MEGLIRPFSAIGKHDAGIAGGKGASLGEMTQAGIPVPPGFVVLAPTFERFIEETDLNVEIDAILGTVNHEEMHTVEHASAKIQSLILAAKMPEDIGADIKKHFTELGAEFVAVRSSATAEDSASAAWAGQLDTYLNTTEAELLANVQRCWASLFTPRAIFYRFEKELHATKISVAVVVQKMVNSDASGIAFSVHPVTEDRNQLIIEAGWGLGEAIVSGQITPDAYVVTKVPREILDKNIATKERGMFRKEGGGNDWKEIEKAKQDEQTLTDAQILEFTELIMRIENHYGFPCDIEWAMEAGVMYITQSRPITTLSLQASNVSSTCTVLAKMYSREKPLFYFALWQADDREGMKRYLDVDIKDDLYIIPPPGTQGSIWFPKEDFEQLMKVAFEKINESHEFAESLIAHARKYWALVRPYLVEKKRCESATEMYEYYRNLVEFWIPMNSVFFMLPDRPGINPVFKEGILTLRTETQEYTEEMPRVFTDFFAKRFPSLTHLAYYISPEETLILDKELTPALIEELETRARDGCFMFGSGIYPMSKLAGMLTDSNLAFEKLEGDGSEISGQTAYKGNVQGSVCIVLAKSDMAKVKKGDVLVTPMTNPDMVPVMKIAGAVVTDEGGMTCHAAIASREMKVPCVVGTKFATQVLKDGDLVEVDADKGVVRKVEG